MERNTHNNGLVNLLAAVAAFIAAFVVTIFVNSQAGQAAAVFLGLGALVAFMSWFQMRLEENERVEKLEVDELARAKGESALFEAKDSEVFPARRAREQFGKFFVPGFCVLLLVLEAGGAWLLWRWTGKSASGFTGLIMARMMPALALFAILALVLFLIGRFSVTISRLENHRLLRPGSSFLLAGAFLCAFTALGMAGVEGKFLRADFWVARGLCVLLGLMAAELLLTLLLEIYRPRVKGKIARPLYDSRVVGLLAQPESLFTTAAQTIDYQFGFKVSETWFYQLLKNNVLALLLVQLAILLLSTCVVFVNAGEQAVLEHFGRNKAVLDPGAHLKLPWPADKIYRYRTDQIQSLYVGYTPDTNETGVLLWTVAHNKEQNFLVGTTEQSALQKDNGDTNDTLKTPPVSLISISIPIQFQITNVLQWAYQNADPKSLLSELATRAVVHYLAGADIDAVLSRDRVAAAQTVGENIQTAANARQLGAKIIFVGLQDIHPPTASGVAASYENVIGARQTRVASNLLAQAEAIQTNALADAIAFTTNSAAEALRVKLETSAFSSAALFTNQIPAYATAPSIYKQRAYFKAFPVATANARKYVLLVTNTQNVLIYELEDKIRADLQDVTVPND